MHDQMGGTWLLRKKPPCATINKCIGIDQKTEKLNRCNIRRARSYEIRYCNSAAYFHISLYLHVTPQTRMVTVFLKIATL